eukprot:6475556-Amphidinium_carterae.1
MDVYMGRMQVDKLSCQHRLKDVAKKQRMQQIFKQQRHAVRALKSKHVEEGRHPANVRKLQRQRCQEERPTHPAWG